MQEFVCLETRLNVLALTKIVVVFMIIVLLSLIIVNIFSVALLLRLAGVANWAQNETTVTDTNERSIISS
jgi:nitrogen fixation/metabolism regulation signal transduction histidine kinase